MNDALSPILAWTSSTTSTTGPHTRLWHSCGVAKVMTMGFLPTTSAKSSFSSDGAGGIRVSIFDMSPATSAGVSVWITGALSPTSGGTTFLPPTCTPIGLVATSRPSRLAVASIAYLPLRLNGTSATYTPRAASGSVAVCLLSNWGETFSDSDRARNGPRADEPSVAPMYSETPAPDSCLPALSKSAKPTRLVPLSRIDTLGASTGPDGRLLMMSGSVRPAEGGKSSALATGCGWAGVLSAPVPPP